MDRPRGRRRGREEPEARGRSARRAITGLLAALALGAIGGCTRGTAAAPFVPGLGEIMTLQQMRHAKLWLAGSAGNWALADYETDELEEGFADVVAFHPTHKDSPVPIAAVVPEIMNGRIAALRAAVAAKDGARFTTAFDALTDGCNACHRATNFGFNVVVRPTASSFLNQDFRPPPK